MIEAFKVVSGGICHFHEPIYNGDLGGNLTLARKEVMIMMMVN
jgi:hypothetical protein